MAASSRPSYLSQASAAPRRSNVPTWGPPPSVATTESSNSTAYKKKGLSLSLASIGNSFETLSGMGDDEILSNKIHPLFNTWDVWFSHRNANSGGKSKREEAVTAGGKESREEWEGGVVKLGGFSSIESLHPFLAYLTPPSSLPASLSSTSHLFSYLPSSAHPPPSSVISDINLFRSPISPLWEHPSNTGGGRIFLRLKKGVADRVMEEVVFALVSERITGGDGEEGESGGGSSKVNGVVLSVRKDEDILSLWTAPCTRNEREAIRESLRAALEPLLTPTSIANLSLDYKPHPVASHLLPNGPSTPHNNHHSRESGTHNSGGHHGSNRRGGAGGEERETRGERNGDGERRSHNNHSNNNNGERGERREGSGNNHNNSSDTRERPSRTGGFSSYRNSESNTTRGEGTTESKSDYRGSTNSERTSGGERSESYQRSTGGGFMGSNGSNGRIRRGSGGDSTLERNSSTPKESRGNASWGRS